GRERASPTALRAPLRGSGARRRAAPDLRGRPRGAPALRLRREGPGLRGLDGLRPRLETRRGLRRGPPRGPRDLSWPGRVRRPQPAPRNGRRRNEGGDGQPGGAHRSLPDEPGGRPVRPRRFRPEL
ncbi:MAG: hypothetical protein AVDCRST_MAG80-1155, partial [uncultured Rubrobacteraceae bacterium]